MPETVREVMTENPRTVDIGSPAIEAAKLMREANAGVALVLDHERLCGIVTDRDIAVRVVAEGRDPSTTEMREFCTNDLITVTPDTEVDEAISLMRERAIRRLPVVENGGKPLGIVSLGDLAEDRDPQSVLGQISASPPNN